MQNLLISKEYRSLNYDERNRNIEHIVMHYTDMLTGKEALARLCDPTAEVSTHYLIENNGFIYSLVDTDKRAWHAGGGDKSYWRGQMDLNHSGIGIEIVNPGHLNGYVPFTNQQYQSLILLCCDLINKYNIKPINIVGHSDIAPSRKKDPGELFDWYFLAKNGIGIYHDILPPKHNPIISKPGDKNVREWQKKLRQFGYNIIVNDVFDQQTLDVVIAFRRRFVQNDLSAHWDIYCQKILDKLYLVDL
jgi:N-acetylmuramoyl-L-alanine amidase